MSPRVLYALIALIAVVLAEDFCDENLCPPKMSQTVCKINDSFGRTCPFNAYVLRINEFVDFILERHNRARDLIAGGYLINYPTAKRMATMQWCDKLSSMASFTVKRCKSNPHECRNTKEFRNVGQVIRKRSFDGPMKAYTDEDLLLLELDELFQGHKNGAHHYLDEFPKPEIAKSFEQFALAITDRNTHVGCAASRFRVDGINNFFLACNYATDNEQGRPIYLTGESGVDCKGLNTTYTHLCAIGEKYDI